MRCILKFKWDAQCLYILTYLYPYSSKPIHPNLIPARTTRLFHMMLQMVSTLDNINNRFGLHCSSQTCSMSSIRYMRSKVSHYWQSASLTRHVAINKLLYRKKVGLKLIQGEVRMSCLMCNHALHWYNMLYCGKYIRRLCNGLQIQFHQIRQLQ